MSVGFFMLLESDFQEGVLLVEEVEEEPAEGYISCSEYHISPSFRNEVHDSLKEVSVHAAESKDLLSKVDGDRVETDDSEE